MENLKSKYNNETLDICELLGCYFVHTFYNSLYLSAKAEAARKSTTKTQEYKLAMLSYINAINGGKEFYKRTIDGMLTWFQTNTKMLTISLEEFQNRILKEYIPRIFYDDMANSEKDKILSSIVTTAANNFASFLNKPNTKHISMIIDGRKEVDNIRYFQKEMLGIMLEQRDIIYGKFIDRNKVKKVDAHFVEKLKDELKKQLAEKIQLKIAFDKAKQVVEQLNKDYANLKEDLNVQTENLQKIIEEKDNKLILMKVTYDELMNSKLQSDDKILQLTNTMNSKPQPSFSHSNNTLSNNTLSNVNLSNVNNNLSNVNLSNVIPPNQVNTFHSIETNLLLPMAVDSSMENVNNVQNINHQNDLLIDNEAMSSDDEESKQDKEFYEKLRNKNIDGLPV